LFSSLQPIERHLRLVPAGGESAPAPCEEPVQGGQPREGALVQAARTGDRSAMRALYDLHVDAVFRLALRLLRVRSDAEDLVQDTFVAAFSNLGGLREDGAFGRWASRICVNRGRSMLRRRSLLSFVGLETVLDEDTGGGLSSPGAPAEVEVELRAIERALTDVPPVHRTAWILRHVEGHELEDVAEICACSLATIKRWLAATDAHLTRKLRLDGLAKEGSS
jgi:RNA polymerase sigma-70 factor (ECF subfamily)